MKENTEMTIQELYELLSRRLDEMDARHAQRLNEMDARHTQRLDHIDERLRGVETGIAELRGRKAGFSVLKDWIVAICAVAALIASIIALTH